mmetsp:Transcript_44394/g.43064  ORF Transcript_44394/g.43064 Transcript_44394/m.43064 type:complete len:96 (-) Transcript_44394:48-335(-)
MGFLIGARVLRIIYRKYKYTQVAKQGKQVWVDKMNKVYEFKEVENLKYILDLTVEDIRKELIKGTFTVHDLVSLYCVRCYTVGRKLNLSSEELFE